MKTWMNKLGGVLLASLLTVMLNGKAFAEEPKSENPETEIHEAAAPALAPDGEASAASVATPVAEQVLASDPASVTVPITAAAAEIITVDEPAPAIDELAPVVEAQTADVAAVPVTETALSPVAAIDEKTVAEIPAVESAAVEAAVVDDPAPESVISGEIDDLTSKDPASEQETLKGDTPGAEANVSAEDDILPVADEPTVAENDAETIKTPDAVPMRSMRLMSIMPAALDATAVNTDNESESIETEPEETKQEEIGTDETSPVMLKATARSAQSSASVFSQNEDGSYVLVNHRGTEKLSADGDVIINAAGLNRLGAISVNGNINLVGSGILLVDEIEMAEGKEFFLQPNKEIYGENGGSVAVFLKQENGDYLLMNGSVDGILDEEYEIPAGVTLVVPDGSRLVMQSVAVGKYTSLGGEESCLY